VSEKSEPAILKFGARSRVCEVIAGHNLKGLDAIVTGGASGIGVETIRALATAGARVVITTRDQTKGESVAATLRKEPAAISSNSKRSTGRHSHLLGPLLRSSWHRAESYIC
jgi:D-arabinose 1-dehydrogenase-like Zn-dependent alcohol dehydrogenase